MRMVMLINLHFNHLPLTLRAPQSLQCSSQCINHQIQCNSRPATPRESIKVAESDKVCDFVRDTEPPRSQPPSNSKCVNGCVCVSGGDKRDDERWDKDRTFAGERATTYCSRHELVSASYSGHLVFIDQLLHHALHLHVPLHEADVGDVDAEQDERLPPEDLVVAEKVDQDQQRDAVEAAVAEQRPPRQREDGLAEQRAHPDHEQDVEHGRADDGADADVVEGHEHTDHTGEELRGAAAGRHEGRARHVVRDAHFFDDYVQRRHKKLVAHDRQCDEHIHDTDYVENDGTLATLLHREQVLGEQRVLVRHIGR